MPYEDCNSSIDLNSNADQEIKGDYTFDSVYFESIEKIGAFPLIINLKNAIKQENLEDKIKCFTILKNQHPQLNQFMLKNN